MVVEFLSKKQPASPNKTQTPMIFLFFDSLSEESFPELVDKTYNGVIFFLSFSIKEANDIEKSLGKMVMSLLGRVHSRFEFQIGHSN